MPRLPRIAAREASRAVERDGWYSIGMIGSHEHFNHPSKAGRVTIPHHGNATLGPKLILSIINQAGLTVIQFIGLL